jgi:hypothetical protein
MPQQITAPTPPLSVEYARSRVSTVVSALDRTDKLTPNLRRMVEGDLWLNGIAWFGPWPDDGVEARERKRIINETRRSFVSRNVQREAIVRHGGGVLAREPKWDLKLRRSKGGKKARLTDAEKTLRQEAIDALVPWWNEKQPHRVMRRAVEHALYLRRGVLRLYVHAGKLAQLTGQAAEAGAVVVPDKLTFAQALDLIEIEAVDPADGAVTRNPKDGEPVGVVFYDAETGETGAAQRRMEITFVQADGSTVLLDTDATDTVVRRGRARKDARARDDIAASFALGGRLPVVQFERDPIITPQTLQLQAAINFALSVVPRTLSDAGWMERIISGAMPPGTWEYDEKGNRIEGSFKPGPFYTGPRTINFLQGTEITSEDANGGVRTTQAPVDVHMRPPVDPKFASGAARDLYVAFLEEVDQAHVMLKQEGEASGRSHEEARDSFKASLTDTANAVNPAGIALLEAVIALGEDLAGLDAKYTSLFRVDFACRLRIGGRSAAESQATTEAIKVGRLSVDTAMEYMDEIDDVDAEKERRDNDPLWQLEVLRKKIEVASLIVDKMGLDPAVAAEMVNLDPAHITLIEQNPPEPEPVQPPAANA